MRSVMTMHLALGALVVVACHKKPPETVAVAPTRVSRSTSSGEVVRRTTVRTTEGMWVTEVGGLWMDTAGVIFIGQRGAMLSLSPAAIAMMSNANIAAHMGTGDSLEIALSRMGAEHARAADVRTFAEQMVTAHTEHLQKARTMLSQAGVTPEPFPGDTMGVTMARHISERLAAMSPGPEYDRELMRAEVAMHRHMLRNLTAMQSRATGETRELVDQTLPVVREHLTEAEAIWDRLEGHPGSR